MGTLEGKGLINNEGVGDGQVDIFWNFLETNVQQWDIRGVKVLVGYKNTISYRLFHVLNKTNTFQTCIFAYKD